MNSNLGNDSPDVVYESKFHHLTDPLFSTVAVLTESGSVVERVRYDAYAENGADVPVRDPDILDELRQIEGHHQLPNKHRDFFESKGLDPDDYVVPLHREQHRLRPNGIHTREGGDWNKEWDEWIEKYGDSATQEQILRKMEEMRKKYGLPPCTTNSSSGR